MLCRELTLANVQHDRVVLCPLKCRSWTCDYCYPGRLRDLRAIAAAGEPSKFITLTIRIGEFDSVECEARRLVEAWRLIRQRAKRERLADKIEFLAVIELTKRGHAHLHILARCPYIEQQWLSDRMREYAGSPIVDISQVKSRRDASRYVAKYMSKGPARIGTCKRYWRSQGYCHAQAVDPTTRKVQGAWSILNLTPIEALQAFQICDWDHRWIDDDTLECVPRGANSRWPCAARPPPWMKRNTS